MVSFHANQLSSALKTDLRYQYNALTELYSDVVVLHYNDVKWAGLKSLQPDCLFTSLYRPQVKKTQNLGITGPLVNDDSTPNGPECGKYSLFLVPCQLWHLMLNDHYSSRVLNRSDSCWSLPNGFMLLEINTKPSAFYAKSPAETGFEMWLLSLIIST